MSVIRFSLTEDHIKLIKHLSWDIIDGVITTSKETPSPFGGMNLYEDVDLILNGNKREFDPLGDKVIEFSDEEKEKIDKIVEELPMALDVVLFNGKFEVGDYKTKYHYRDWKKQKIK